MDSFHEIIYLTHFNLLKLDENTIEYRKRFLDGVKRHCEIKLETEGEATALNDLLALKEIELFVYKTRIEMRKNRLFCYFSNSVHYEMEAAELSGIIFCETVYVEFCKKKFKENDIVPTEWRKDCFKIIFNYASDK